jgi:hypothetical protein
MTTEAVQQCCAEPLVLVNQDPSNKIHQPKMHQPKIHQTMCEKQWAERILREYSSVDRVIA